MDRGSSLAEAVLIGVVASLLELPAISHLRHQHRASKAVTKLLRPLHPSRYHTFQLFSTLLFRSPSDQICSQFPCRPY